MSGPNLPAELIGHAERVFGDKETATAWFYRPNSNLLGRRPIDEIEAGGEALVATILDTLGPPEDDPGS